MTTVDSNDNDDIPSTPTPTTTTTTSSPVQHKTTTARHTVLLLCGLPGAGKSSLASRWAAAMRKNNNDAAIVLLEYDQIQESILLTNNNNKPQTDDDDNDDQEEDPSEEERARQAWRASRRQALDSLRHHLQPQEEPSSTTSKFILLDDNFFLRSMRKQVYQVCQQEQQQQQQSLLSSTSSTIRTIFFGVIWLDTPLAVCRHRNQQRGARAAVPDEILVRMQARFEAPTITNPWERPVLRLQVLENENEHANSSHVDAMCHFCRHDVQEVPSSPPPPPLCDARPSQPPSPRQQLDQTLRACVSVVAHLRPRDASRANAVRQALLLLSRQHSTNEEPSLLSLLPEAFVQGLDTTDWTPQELQELQCQLKNAVGGLSQKKKKLY